MKKLARFAIIAFLFIALLMAAYVIVPAIVFVLGGSFKAVSQSPSYITMFIFFVLASLLYVFSKCFDKNFYSCN